MECKRFSKTRWARFRLCPFKDHRHSVLGVPEEIGDAGRNGIETHMWRHRIVTDAADLASALRAVTSDEVKRLVRDAIANDVHFPFRHAFEHERFVAIDREGRRTPASGFDEDRNPVDGDGSEFAVAILDRVGLMEDGDGNRVVLVEDLKTSREGWDADDECERHLYVLAARALYPEVKLFRFEYFYCRTGRRAAWDYEYEATGRVAVTPPRAVLTDPEMDPLLRYVLDRAAEIEAADPIPTPGAHCRSWYGRPCQFLGNECPIGDRLAGSVLKPEPEPPAAGEILQLPPEHRVAAAFMAVQRGLVDPDGITPEIASLALQGVHQIEAGARGVKSVLAEWARENGPIRIGGDRFGWNEKEKYVVKRFRLAALKMIHAAGGWEAVARAVNVSPTSLRALGKRKYGDLRDRVLKLCGETAAVREFGPIKETK